MTIARACRPPAQAFAGGWQAAGGLLSTLLESGHRRYRSTSLRRSALWASSMGRFLAITNICIDLRRMLLGHRRVPGYQQREPGAVSFVQHRAVGQTLPTHVFDRIGFVVREQVTQANIQVFIYQDLHRGYAIGPW